MRFFKSIADGVRKRLRRVFTGGTRLEDIGSMKDEEELAVGKLGRSKTHTGITGARQVADS